jgi:hypothetical protein
MYIDYFNSTNSADFISGAGLEDGHIGNSDPCTVTRN